MTLKQARNVLDRNGQGHVLRFWEQLDAAQRTALLAQLATLDFASIARMRQMIQTGAGSAPVDEPHPAGVTTPDPAARAAAGTRGEAELRAGRIGVLLVAGGQGSRLGYDGPKGAYAIGPVSGATLFHYHARKVLALARRHGAPLPLYIMTSDTNDAATQACFEANGFFGLPRGDVFFFRQGMWPALDASGGIILDTPGHIFMSPDGHGGTLAALAASGGLADMERRGLTTVFYFQVDNPLVEVADPAFIGLHLLERADISIKVCAKRDPNEGLGVVVVRGGRYEMVEYTELTDEQKNRRTPDGSLVFKYGSVAIHLFSLPFLKQEAGRPLPLHLAHKKIPTCADDGTVVRPTSNTGYKFETFIFDVLPDARKVVNLAFDRRDEFSPVKNADGADSPETCRRDLQAKWLRWFAAAGAPLPTNAASQPVLPLEIDPAYALDAADLMKKGLTLRDAP